MSYQTLVDASTLQQKLASADWRVLDCRFNLMEPEAGRELYRQGHIPGALYADLNRDLSSPITADSGRHPLPEPELLARRLADWGICPDTQVVVYDDMGGAMASRAWWLLRWLGHEKVALLDGGLPAWERAGGPLSNDFEVVEAAPEYPFECQDDWRVSAAQVVANLEAPSFRLVDARNAERFRAEQEPIDPVAGHIPGALCRPLGDNLDDSGCFKPADQLRQEWLQLLGTSAPEQVVTMCGSGVTACHHLLALELAGFGGARIYPGSWSEWIRDPGRPVATG